MKNVHQSKCFNFCELTEVTTTEKLLEWLNVIMDNILLELVVLNFEPKMNLQVYIILTCGVPKIL